MTASSRHLGYPVSFTWSFLSSNLLRVGCAKWCLVGSNRCRNVGRGCASKKERKWSERGRWNQPKKSSTTWSYGVTSSASKWDPTSWWSGHSGRYMKGANRLANYDFLTRISSNNQDMLVHVGISSVTFVS